MRVGDIFCYPFHCFKDIVDRTIFRNITVVSISFAVDKHGLRAIFFERLELEFLEPGSSGSEKD